MVTRDAFGQVVNQGDLVSFALGTGTSVLAKLDQIQTLAPNQPPIAVISMQIVVPIPQNGVIAGVTALPQPKEEKKLISG